MEYSLWNVSGGFWPTGNQSNIPMEPGARQTYYPTPTNGLPVFHSSLNVSDDLSHFSAIASTQPYRQAPEFLPPKNVIAGLRSVVPLMDDKNQMEGVVPITEDLLEPRGMDNLPNETARTNIEQNNVKKETSPNYESCSDSNGQPVDYLKQGNYQTHQAMYGMILNQIASCKQSDDDDDDQKIMVNSTESRSSSNADESSSLEFECGECGFVAETRSSLKKHIIEAHPECQSGLLEKSPSVPNPSCPMVACRFKANDRSELEAHLTKHVADGFTSGSKKKGCPVALQRVRYEREEYRCQLCAYSCTIEKAFYKHLKTHSLGQQPAAIKISCVICGKDRISEVDMTKHMKKHRDDRYFCCDICIFKTVQLKKLIQHRRMHTGEKPHLCPHCSYRSARRDNLRSHVRRVHKKENLYCDTFSPLGILVSASASNQQTSPAESQME